LRNTLAQEDLGGEAKRCNRIADCAAICIAVA
jgi:hypothetical protein